MRYARKIKKFTTSMLNIIEGEMLMKKSLIALAVAGAMTAPMIAQADATLYGSFRVGVESVSDNASIEEEKDLDMVDQSSRIGIKGDVDLGLDGTKGLFHWEANINSADSNSDILKERLSYIGAQGDWGKALIGRQYHPHYLLINGPTNIFNPGSSDFGERFNLVKRTNVGVDHKRVDNTIAYYSPKMNGFQVIAGAVIAADEVDDADGLAADNDNSLDDSVDGYNIAAVYAANNMTVAASYATADNSTVAANEDKEQDVWGLSATYKLDNLKLALSYEDLQIDDAEGDKSEDQQAITLAATYTMGATSIYGRYADFDNDIAGEEDLSQWGIGVQQKLGKGRVFLEHVNNDSDDTAGDRTTAGYRVDF